MRSYIQITDTNNEVLRLLPLGDLSSITTYSFRVWNNYSQAAGIAAIKGLTLNLMFPPKQGIQTLVNNDVIKIRCTFSGETSENLSNNFQTFPITGEKYNRLEPYTYNEYEVQIDFSSLTTSQKETIDSIGMEYNISVSYERVLVPFSEPQEKEITSESSVLITSLRQTTSDSTIS